MEHIFILLLVLILSVSSYCRDNNNNNNNSPLLENGCKGPCNKRLQESSELAYQKDMLEKEFPNMKPVKREIGKKHKKEFRKMRLKTGELSPKEILEQLNSKSAAIKEQAQLIAELQLKNKETAKRLEELSNKLKRCRQISYRERTTATSCLPFENSSSLHMIKVPGYRAFQVSCNSRLAGSGWTVIQRRLNGAVDFNRNWREYRSGFGDLRREFFIGLEKLHQLTAFQPYELLVVMEDVHNNTKYAHYDDFKVGNEDSGYKLISLGEFKGNAGDAMRIDEGMKFTTFDRDNDRKLDRNCAAFKHGGWWYRSCSWSNLNGGYLNTRDEEMIWWRVSLKAAESTVYIRLKTVQMLIRPKDLNEFELIH